MPGNGAAASYGDLLVTSLVVLGAVCVAAFLVVRVLGRFLSTGATGRMRGARLLDVVARVPLEPRRSLYVVEVPGKTLLVGTSEMGLSVLTELDGGEVEARVRAARDRPTFADLVKAAWARRRHRTPTSVAKSSDSDVRGDILDGHMPAGDRDGDRDHDRDHDRDRDRDRDRDGDRDRDRESSTDPSAGGAGNERDGAKRTDGDR